MRIVVELRCALCTGRGPRHSPIGSIVATGDGYVLRFDPPKRPGWTWEEIDGGWETVIKAIADGEPSPPAKWGHVGVVEILFVNNVFKMIGPASPGCSKHGFIALDERNLAEIEAAIAEHRARGRKVVLALSPRGSTTVGQ